MADDARTLKERAEQVRDILHESMREQDVAKKLDILVRVLVDITSVLVVLAERLDRLEKGGGSYDDPAPSDPSPPAPGAGETTITTHREGDMDSGTPVVLR